MFRACTVTLRTLECFRDSNATLRRSGGGCALSALMFRGVDSRTFQVHLIGPPRRRDSCVGPFPANPRRVFSHWARGPVVLWPRGQKTVLKLQIVPQTNGVFKRAHGAQSNWAVTGSAWYPWGLRVGFSRHPPSMSLRCDVRPETLTSDGV